MATNNLLHDDSDKKIQSKHLELFCLIWLDPGTNVEETACAEQRLRSLINYFKRFQDVRKCQKYIQECSENDRLILIVSGQLGKAIVPSIHDYQQVVSIYVYCMDKKRNELWASKHSKVKAVIVELEELITRISDDHRTQEKIIEPLPIDIFNAGESTSDVNGQFVFSQVLVDCLLRLKPNEKDKTELIDRCQTEYKGNSVELDNLREFQKTYKSGQVLSWYTKETFFYKTLNTCLRKQNIHMMFLFHEYLSDINQQLKQYQSKDSITVYRGQMMSNEELERIKSSMGQLISINSFFSTSTSYANAVSFLKFSTSSAHLQRVLFQIKADPKKVTNRPFADISKCSEFVNEAEVLFMIGSIFRLESIECDDLHIWVIKMTLSSDEEHGLKHVLMYMKAQIGTGETTLRTLGKFLWTMGKFDLAETYFIRFLNELDSSDGLACTLYEDLGQLAAVKGEYNKSVQWHQKSLQLKNSKQTDTAKSIDEPENAAQQLATANAQSETKTVGGMDVEAFKSWLTNYIKKKAAAVAEEQNSRTKRHPKSVENFCYILESQISISKTEEQTLHGLINLGFTFADINSDECIKFFRGIRLERIILILSKASLQELAKAIRDEPYLSAIYVIDSSRGSSCDLKMYRGTFSNIAQLCKQLETDLPIITYDLTSICSIPADYAKMSTINYFQALKDIALDKDEKRNLKKEMIEFCREKYADNAVQLRFIDEFEKNFQADQAIQWYLRQEAFIYKMLTRACRVFDVDILYKLRYFIQNFHRRLESLNRTSAITVYRTIRVSKGLVEKMKNYEGGLFSFNEFLFADKSQPNTEPSPVNLESKLVRFRIDLAAGIARYNDSSKPNEVLLTFGLIFRLEKIEAVDDETYNVKLTVDDKALKDGQQVSKDLREAVRGTFPMIRMAKLMWQRDLYDDMEYFSTIVLNDSLAANDESSNIALGGLLHSLGNHCYETKQYDKGLIHFQNALKVYQRVLSPDDLRLTPTYNNIGSIYHRQDLNEKAYEYHRKAFDIQKNSTRPDMDSVSTYAGNIASVLIKLHKYKEAVKFSEINLKFEEKLHPDKNDAQMAAKYYNHAGMQYRAELYAEALDNYEKCLAIELKCHPANHPTVAATYHSIGTALDKLGRFKEAKEAVEKAVERLLCTKKEDDQDVQSHKAYIKKLEGKLWMRDMLKAA
ncbi:unnamed protein product [Adineta ricciae]|uniref:ADP ribosyltransferase domain-containing protein n=2 Tax=Adineta ricciae TaxID=249248 RepID=A0A815QHC8_ADIRI|nr:unnamed protein product [Adineta ricciae]